MNKNWAIQSELKKLPTVVVGLFSLREKAPTKNASCSAENLKKPVSRMVPKTLRSPLFPAKFLVSCFLKNKLEKHRRVPKKRRS